MKIIQTDTLDWIKKARSFKFDLIFLDPPFSDFEFVMQVILELTNKIQSWQSLIYLESHKIFPEEELMHHLKKKWKITKKTTVGISKGIILQSVLEK